nr:hypothetical protein [Tanacetum cinerariifolium]
QFWNTTVVNRSGDVTRLQALVDKKKIEIANDVAQPTLPLQPSPVIPSSPPHQSPRPPPPQATEGLESANTAQQLEILKLKARVKKL